jgi:putative membrane protein
MWGAEGMGWGWGWGAVGVVHMIVFWTFVVLVVALLVRWLAGGHVPPPGRSAREILDERYAKGELTREQFEQMKADLSPERPAPMR